MEWQKAMQQKPSMLNQAAKRLQTRFNRIIPEKIHQFISTVIKQMTRTVLVGSGYTTANIAIDTPLEVKEAKIRKRISFYRSAAAAEGGATGFGGILWGFADLPLWLSVKMKMLFEIAANYGFNVKDYKERVYILYIFQLTFSSQQHRNKIYRILANWEKEKEKLPEDINALNWRTYWEEYRDHIDLAKMLQLIPGLGAAVGSFVNYKLTDKLGRYAMNAYRMRVLQIEGKK